MLARLGVIALVFGIILSASSGQAQEQGERPQGQTEQQQAPPQTLPLPIPIEIIEDQAQAEARERGEQEARQREIRDLAAQEGMNAATQSIEAATRDMRDYALASTLLVAIGTALLFYTLSLTRQANKAAVKGAEIAEKALIEIERPWMLVSGALASLGTAPTESGGRETCVSIQSTFINYGRSPAFDVKVEWDITLAPPDAEIEFNPIEISPLMVGCVVGPGQQGGTNDKVFTGGDAQRLLRQELAAFILTRIEYSIAPGRSAYTVSCRRAIVHVQQSPETGEVTGVRTGAGVHSNWEEAT